jgi:hypothetical protein
MSQFNEQGLPTCNSGPLKEHSMTDSFWLEDTQIVILTDSPVEGLDMAEMAKAKGYGPSLLIRATGALIALLSDGELRPRIVVLGRSLDPSEAQACMSVCKASNAAVVLIDNAALEGVLDAPLMLQRPFTLDHLQATFGKARLR